MRLPPNQTSSGPVPVTVLSATRDKGSNTTWDQLTPSKCQTCSLRPMAQTSRAHDPHKVGAPILVIPVAVLSGRHETPSKCAIPIWPTTHRSSSALPQIDCQLFSDKLPATALCQEAPLHRSTPPHQAAPFTCQIAVAHASRDGETQMSDT